MERSFLEGLEIEAEKIDAILKHQAEKRFESLLKDEGVRSVSAAKGALSECEETFSKSSDALDYLKKEHPYLFESTEPIFCGPAGNEDDQNLEPIRRALGI